MSEINNTKITLSLEDGLIKALENAENVIRFIAKSNNIDKLNYIWEKDTKILRLTLILKSTNEEVIIKAVENGVSNTNNDYGNLILSNNESDNVLNNGLDSILCVGKNIIEIDLTELEINANIESDIFQSFITGPNSYYPIVDNKFTINSTEYTILDSVVADNIYKVDNDNFTINETSYFINPDAQVILNNKLTIALVNDNKFSLDDKNYIISSKFIMELLETTGNISDDNKFTIENTVFTISEDYKNITCKFEGEKEDGNTNTRYKYKFNIFGDTFLVEKTRNNRVIKVEDGDNNTIKILDNKFTIGSNQFSITGDIDKTDIICDIALEENIFDLTDKGNYIIDNEIVYKANKIVLTNDEFSLGGKNYLLSQREVVIVNNESEDSAEYYLVSDNSFTINDITYTKYWSNKNYLIISGNYKINNNQFKIGDSIYTINSNVDLEESIKYLESIGIDTGSSIYLLDKDNKDTLVTKESYIKLLYKTIIDLEENNIDEIYSFIDKNGQTVYRNTLFRVYNPEEVDIYLTKTKNYELVELKENVYGIGIVAGNFSIGGTIGYTDYSIINNKYNKVKTGKVKVSEIPSFQLKFVENTDIFNKNNTIISGEKLIEYTDTYFNNNTKDDTTYLSEELTIYFDSPGLYNEVVRCQKTINVIQAVDYNIPWQLILPETNDDVWTRFKEKEITGLNITKEIPVIVFNNPSSKKTAEIGIKTTDSNIATALGNNQFSLIYEHSLDYPSDSNPEINFNNYFSIDTKNIYIKEINTTTINYYEIKIPIIYRNSDINSDKWAPCSGNTQELIKVTIKLNESLELGNYSSSFYVAGRSSNIPVPKIYEYDGEDINNYLSKQPISEIKISNISSKNIILLYNNLETHYWVNLETVDGIVINSGNKTDDLNKYNTNGLSKPINIAVIGKIGDVLVFSDLNEELWEKYKNQDDLNINDWKINIFLPTVTLSVKTEKQITSFWYDKISSNQISILNNDGILSGNLNEKLKVNQNDIYELYISSTQDTKLSLKNNNDNIKFVDKDLNFSDSINLTATAKLQGVTVDIKLKNINTIDTDTFKDCKDLEEIIIPNTISIIESEAFSGCTALKKITLPSTLRRIESKAFYNCSNLNENNIILTEDNLEYIAPDAFDNSGINLKSSEPIILGKTLIRYPYNSVLSVVNLDIYDLKTIASKAFNNCGNIEELVIPNTIRYIGDNAFEGCNKLIKITFNSIVDSYNIPLTVGHYIDTNNNKKSILYNSDDGSSIKIVKLGRNIKYFTETKEYTSVGDSLYSDIDWWDDTYKSKNQLVGYPDECGRDYEDGYKNIDLGYMSMFRDLKNLNEFEFIEGVELIRDLEFYGCSNLSNVIFCNSIIEIGFKSFYNTGIKEVIIGEDSTEEAGSKLKYIWTKAFMECHSLTTVNINSYNLEKLGRLIFCNCTDLSPKSEDWKSLDRGEIEETYKNLFSNFKIRLDSVNEIGNGLIFKTGIYNFWLDKANRDAGYSHNLILINYDDYSTINGNGWIINSKLTNLTNWEGTRLVGELYSDIVGICNDLGYGSMRPRHLHFPKSLRYVGSRAYKNSLGGNTTWICFPGEKEILFRKDAFYKTSLHYVKSFLIKKIDNEEFDLTDWCNKYTFENEYANPLCGTVYLYRLYNNEGDDSELVHGNVHINTDIPDYAFYGWTRHGGYTYNIIGNLSNENSKGRIGKKAFAVAEDLLWNDLSKGLKYVELSGVTEIGEEAFKGHKDISDKDGIIIYNSPNLKSIGNNAFSETNWIEKQTVYYNNETNDTFSKKESKGVCYLPIYEGETFTSVEDNTISHYYAYAVKFPQDTKGNITDGDFINVLGNKFDENKEVIGFSNLENLSGSSEINITTISEENETLDRDFIITDKIKFIGENALNGNNQIASIRLPNTITYIGDNAFSNCGNLTNISLSNKINYFGKDAFKNIPNLSSIRIFRNNNLIINSSFSENNFEEIILPDLDTWIEADLNDINSCPIMFLQEGGLLKFGDNLIDTIQPVNPSENFTIIFDNKIKQYTLCNLPIEELTLFGSGTKIEKYAFYNCKRLKKITLSENIQEIDEFAFYRESDLDTLIVEFKRETAPSIKKNSFNPDNTIFIIPDNGQNYDINEFCLFRKIKETINTITGTYLNKDVDDKITIYSNEYFGNNIDEIIVDNTTLDSIKNEIESVSTNNLVCLAISNLTEEDESDLELNTVIVETINSNDSKEISIEIPVIYKKDETNRRRFEFINNNSLLLSNINLTTSVPLEYSSPVIARSELQINSNLLSSNKDLFDQVQWEKIEAGRSSSGEIIYKLCYKCNKFPELNITVNKSINSKYPIRNSLCDIKLTRDSEELIYSIYQDAAKQLGIYVKNEYLNPEEEVILFYNNEESLQIPIISNYEVDLIDGDAELIDEGNYSYSLKTNINPESTLMSYGLNQKINCGIGLNDIEKEYNLSISLSKRDNDNIIINGVNSSKSNIGLGTINLPISKELNTDLEKLFNQNIKTIEIFNSSGTSEISDTVCDLIVNDIKSEEDFVILSGKTSTIDNIYRSKFKIRLVIPQGISNITSGVSLENLTEEIVSNLMGSNEEYLLKITTDEDEKHFFRLKPSNNSVVTLFNSDGNLNNPYIYAEKPSNDLLEAEITLEPNETQANLLIVHSANIDNLLDFKDGRTDTIEQLNDYILNITPENDINSTINIVNDGIGDYNINRTENVSIEIPKNILNVDVESTYIVNKSKTEIVKEKYLTSPIVVEYENYEKDQKITLFNLEKLDYVYKIFTEVNDFIDQPTSNEYLPVWKDNGVNKLTVCIYFNDITKVDTTEFFKDCDKITNIMLPHGISSIGNSMFSGCTNLDVIGIPYSVTSIGDNAFKDCENLVTLEIPDSVESIGNNSFSGCIKLVHLVIPESVKTLGESLFEGCTNLFDLLIFSNNINFLYNNIFTGATNLNIIHFAGNLPKIINTSGELTNFDLNLDGREEKLYINYCSDNDGILESCYTNNIEEISDTLTVLDNSGNEEKVELTSDFYKSVVTETVKIPPHVGKDLAYLIICRIRNKGIKYMSFDWNDRGLIDNKTSGNWYNPNRYSRSYFRVLIDVGDQRDYITYYYYLDENNSISYRQFHQLAQDYVEGHYSFKEGYIHLPTNLEAVGVKAFDDSGFKLLHFPRGFKRLDNSAVYNNKKLKGVIFYPEGELTHFGTSYSTSCKNDDAAFKYHNEHDSVTNRVNSRHGFSVFGDCTGLLSIEIPKIRGNIFSVFKGIIPAWSFCDCTNLRYVGFLNTNEFYSLGKCCFKNCNNLISDFIANSIKFYQYCLENCTNLRNIVINNRLSLLSTENYNDYFKGSANIEHLYAESSNIFGEDYLSTNITIDSITNRKLSDLTIHTKDEYKKNYISYGFNKISGDSIEKIVNISQDILKLKITQKAVPYSTLKIGDIDVIPRLTGVDTELTRCLGIHSSGYAINSGMSESGDWNIITIEFNNAVEGGSIIKDGKLNLEIVKIGDSNLYPPNLNFIDSGIISNETEEDLTTIRAWIKIDESYTKENNVFEDNILVDNYYILLHNKNQNDDIKETWALGYIRGWTGLKIDDSNNIYTHNINTGNTVKLSDEENPILIERAQAANNYSYNYNPSIDVVQCEPIFEGGEWKLGEEVVINSCFNESIINDNKFNNNEYCILNIPEGNIEFTEGLSATTKPSITSEYDADISDGANTNFPKLKVNFILSNEAYLESPAKITYSNISINCWKVNPTGEEEIFVEDSTTSEVFELTETYTQPNYITPKFNIELWLMDS